MLENFSIILEIIATGLLAIHFFVKRKAHTQIDQWLLTRLRRKITPRGRVRPIIMVIVGILAFIVMISMAIWGFIKDYKGGAWQTGDLVVSYLLFAAAVIVGIITILVILWIHYKYRFPDFAPINLIITFSILITFIFLFTLMLTGTHSVKITSFLLTYSFTMLVMAIWLSAMPLIQKYLTIKSGVLVRFGFFIFVVAKFIQLSLTS